MKRTVTGVGVIAIASIFLWILFTLLAYQSRSAQAVVRQPPDLPPNGALVYGAGLTPSVKLNEIMVKNLSVIADKAGDFESWIELYNAGLLPIDVGGMALSNGHSIGWPIPTDTIIPSHGYLLIWADGEPQEGAFHTSFLLRAGQAISLIDKPVFSETLIDHFVVAPTAPNWSWARHPNGRGPWTLSERPSPGTFNATHWLYLPVVAQIDEPPELNVVINELMAINDSTIADDAGEYDDWVELYNPSPDAVNVGGMYLSDDLGDPARWQIPAGTVISENGFLLVWADAQEDQGPLHTNFKLSGDGENLLLTDSDGHGFLDWLTFTAQQSDVSFGRLPDGTDNWQSFVYPTPGNPNSIYPVRVVSTTHYPVSPGAADSVTVTKRVVTAPRDITTTRIVTIDSAVTATLFHKTETNNILRNESFSQTVMQENGNGLYVAQIPPRPSQSVVQYYVHVRAVWGQTVTDPAGAPNETYHYMVDPSLGAIAINEFMAANSTVISDGNGDFDDWIELFNLDTLDLDLSGYYLTDDLNEPTRWQFPIGVTVPVGGFVLIWADDESNEGALHTNFKLAAGGEAVGLFGPDGSTAIDALTFSTQVEDVSLGRYPDGVGSWRSLSAPTPGIANEAPTVGVE